MRFLPAMTLALLGACGGEAFTTGSDAGSLGGGAGAAGTGGGSATGGTRDAAPDSPTVTGAGGMPDVKNSGDCETKDDCGGDPCVELILGGYRVCQSTVPEATTCSVPAGQCCKSSDCTMGTPPSKCVLGPAQPSCGGAVMVPTNVCVKDACRTALDCSGDNPICQPAGVFGSKAARCLTGGCRFDRDCLGQGASCAPVVESCCNAVIGLYCVYPNGCRRDSDCGVGQHCAIQGNRTACVAGAVACPASL